MTDTHENKTRAYLDAIDQIARRAIPESVFARAKESLLDYCAVTVAGAKFFASKLVAYEDFAKPEPGEFVAIGLGRKLALKEAVFLNGLNAHALDFDDGTNSGIIHLGSPVFSVLLPLAQRYDLTLRDVLRAAIIGYEASYTMAVSIQPTHKSLGFHATGTCGTLGATLAGCYLLGFNEKDRENALATAAIAASGMLRALDDGSELKPFNVAKTSLLALTSLQLAKAGFLGHYDVFSGDRGFFKMMTGSSDVELRPTLLNGTYAIQKTYTKPYASCRYTHPAIEATARLGKEFKIAPENVEAITVRTYSLAVSKHDHTEIPCSASAKMSIPYSVAVGLIYGKAGLQEFEEQIVREPRVAGLTRKVVVLADEQFSADFPATQTATVEIRTRDGQSLVCRVDFPKGEPENPLSPEEFKSRFLGLTSYADFPTDRAERLYDLVQNNENATARDALALL